MRFVAYEGPPRAPLPIYNEKWPISLGQIVRNHGRIDDASMAHLLAGIDRFVALARYMEIGNMTAVATAAIRAASNGQTFVEEAAKRGLDVSILDGAGEARAAAMGVLCNYPGAGGYVADLGGGSLEIARIDAGKICDPVSLPLGTSKLIDLDEAGWVQAGDKIRSAFAEIDASIVPGQLLFMVGGTWRAVAHLHQLMQAHPIDILSHYDLQPADLPELIGECRNSEALASARNIPSQRVPLMPGAARMLALLNDMLQPARFVSNPMGIREGLLMSRLTEAEFAKDPLIEATRFGGRKLGRGYFDGDRLFNWMQPLFADRDEGQDERLRHAACLLADCAWNYHPDYRSANALQIGIEGNWLGVDGAGRARIARALWSAYGDSKNDRALLSKLAKRAQLRRADKWGLAIRLGMRIDGGTGAILAQAPISVDDGNLILRLPENMPGDSLRHRLNQLADGLGLKARLA